MLCKEVNSKLQLQTWDKEAQTNTSVCLYVLIGIFLLVQSLNYILDHFSLNSGILRFLTADCSCYYGHQLPINVLVLLSLVMSYRPIHHQLLM